MPCKAINRGSIRFGSETKLVTVGKKHGEFVIRKCLSLFDERQFMVARLGFSVLIVAFDVQTRPSEVESAIRTCVPATKQHEPLPLLCTR